MDLALIQWRLEELQSQLSGHQGLGDIGRGLARIACGSDGRCAGCAA